MTDIMADNLLTANQYLKQAADCREQSERALNSHHKENWLKIAGQWQHLAEVAETYLPREALINAAMRSFAA